MFGIAFFDNPSMPSGGWYSLDGDKARRFSSIADLDPRLIWITNANYYDYRANDLRTVSHLRNAGFFRLSLTAIANEIEASGPDGSKDVTAVVSALSAVAGQVFRLVKTLFGDIPIGLTLHDSLYDALGLDAADPSVHFQRQIQSAFQENSVVAGKRWAIGSENVTLVPNRICYAETVLSYPVPAGALREFPAPMSIEDFLALEHPALAQVEVDLSCAENPELLAYGVQMSGTAVPRAWMTQPEAHFLYKSGARIKIHRTIQAQASTSAPQLPKALTQNAFVRCAYSGGLLAEAILYALMSKRYVVRQKGTRSRYFFPFRAAYLRAVDRMLSFVAARRLADAGFRVKRYAYGSVTINATQEEIPEIMNMGADMGFMLLAVPSLGKDGEAVF